MTWNKLYKRSLFIDNKIRFPVGRLHEDNFTTYKLFYHADKISFVNKPLYYYVQRSNSIMSKTFNNKRFDMFDMLNETEQFFKQKNVNIPNELQSARIIFTLGVYNDYVQSNRTKASDSRMKSELKKIGNVNSNPLISKKHKFLYQLAKFSPTLYGTLRKKHDERSVDQ